MGDRRWIAEAPLCGNRIQQGPHAKVWASWSERRRTLKGMRSPSILMGEAGVTEIASADPVPSLVSAKA
jgi:hypothetical protein